MHIVNFLGITLDFRNNAYELYRKPGNHPVYINKNLNYRKTILRELLKLISKKLFDLSSNKEIFEKATLIYSEALKKRENPAAKDKKPAAITIVGNNANKN